MGGHGAYVWPVYAVALVALGGLLIWSLRARRKVRRELEARSIGRRSPGRAGRPGRG